MTSLPQSRFFHRQRQWRRRWCLGIFVAAWCALFGWGDAIESASQAVAAPFVPVRDAHCVAMSPDGRLAAIGYSGQSNSEFPPRPHPSPRKAGVVQLFDVASGKRLRRIETFGDLTRVHFSPDGSLLAMSRLFQTDGGIELNEVRLWDVASGQVKWVFDRCHAFSFFPHKRAIVVASRKRCVAYDLTTGDKLRQYPELANAVTLVHGADGQALLGIVEDGGGFRIRGCHPESAVMQAQSPLVDEPFYSLAVCRDAGALASGHSRGSIVLWNPKSLAPTGQLRTGGTGRAFPFFSPDGSLLAAADQANSDITVWEAGTGRELVRYTFKQGQLHTYSPKSAVRIVRPEEDPARFAFAPDGEAFLGGPYGGILRLVQTGRDIARFGE